MGRRKLSESEGLSDISSKSENFSDIPQLESPPRKKLKKKYKKSHKYKLSESEYSETETDYIEKKKHKHKKHKSHRHRSEYCTEEESYKRLKRRHGHHSTTREIRSKHHKYNEKAESRNPHSSHKKHERDRFRIIENYPTREIETQDQESSRWDDNEQENDTNLLTSIKTEPLSNSEDDDRSERQLKSQKNPVDKKQQKEKIEGWGKDVPVKMEKEETTETKETVNFGLSGKLAEDANTYNGIVIKYSQPPEARKPKRRWRWYIFKGDEELPFLPLHRQSAYLIGRERKVADIPTDHPSCSKQHAVLQYRLVSYHREDGTVGRTVKPYILDLESANGTYVNNRRVDSRRYVELLEKDVVKFGYSSREYVLLHEASKGSDQDMPDVGTDLSPVSLLRSN